jgi:hypothetical protein
LPPFVFGVQAAGAAAVDGGAAGAVVAGGV